MYVIRSGCVPTFDPTPIPEPETTLSAEGREPSRGPCLDYVVIALRGWARAVLSKLAAVERGLPWLHKQLRAFLWRFAVQFGHRRERRGVVVSDSRLS